MEATLADAFFSAFPNVFYLLKIPCQIRRCSWKQKIYESNLVWKSIDMVPYQDSEARKSNVLEKGLACAFEKEK